MYTYAYTIKHSLCPLTGHTLPAFCHLSLSLFLSKRHQFLYVFQSCYTIGHTMLSLSLLCLCAFVTLNKRLLTYLLTNQYCHQLYHLSLCSPNSVEMKHGAVADADLAGCHVADWPMSLNCFQLFQAPVQLRQCTRCKLIKLLLWYTYITHTLWNNTRQLHKPEILCPVNGHLESKHYRTASSEWLLFSKHLTDVSTYLPVTISNYRTILSNTHTHRSSSWWLQDHKTKIHYRIFLNSLKPADHHFTGNRPLIQLNAQISFVL